MHVLRLYFLSLNVLGCYIYSVVSWRIKQEVVTIPLRFKIIEKEEKISSCLEESSGIFFFRNFCAQTWHSIDETKKIDK